MDSNDLNTMLDQAPAAGSLVLLVMLVAGLVLWLVGRFVLRFAVCVSGMAIGALAAFPLAQSFTTDPQTTLAAVVAGAVCGCLAAWRVFTIWMGLSMAILIGLAVPAGVLMWDRLGPQQDTPGWYDADGFTHQATPPLGDPQADVNLDTALQEPPALDDESVPSRSLDDLTLNLEPRDPQAADASQDEPLGHVRALLEQQRQQFVIWWKDLGDERQNQVMATGFLGGLIGLMMGLFVPTFSASFQTSLAGGILIFSGARGLIALHAPALMKWVPGSPGSIALTLAVITVIGVMIQTWGRPGEQNGQGNGNANGNAG